MAETFNILIIGGYGNAGRFISEYIFSDIIFGNEISQLPIQLTIAGRNYEKAESFTGFLNDKFKRNHALPLQLNISDTAQLKTAFANTNLVILAVGTTENTDRIIREAINHKIDYYDITFSSQKHAILNSYKPDILMSKLCFITDGGYHPGIPAALIRYGATKMDCIKTGWVGALMNIDWKSYQFAPETIEEFTDELRNSGSFIFKDRQWKKARYGGMFDMFQIDFGPGFGKKQLAPFYLEEMRELTANYPELEKTGFYIGGMDWFSNWVSFPFAITWYLLFPKSNPGWIKRMIFSGMKRFTKPPFYTIMKAECTGESIGKLFSWNMVLSHEDGYVFTAIPVVATLKQYFSKRKPGLWTQANYVEPRQFITDIKQMGIKVTEEIKQ